jgi:hypothetical protein
MWPFNIGKSHLLSRFVFRGVTGAEAAERGDNLIQSWFIAASQFGDIGDEDREVRSFVIGTLASDPVHARTASSQRLPNYQSTRD